MQPIGLPDDTVGIFLFIPRYFPARFPVLFCLIHLCQITALAMISLPHSTGTFPDVVRLVIDFSLGPASF